MPQLALFCNQMQFNFWSQMIRTYYSGISNLSSIKFIASAIIFGNHGSHRVYDIRKSHNHFEEIKNSVT